MPFWWSVACEDIFYVCHLCVVKCFLPLGCAYVASFSVVIVWCQSQVEYRPVAVSRALVGSLCRSSFGKLIGWLWLIVLCFHLCPIYIEEMRLFLMWGACSIWNFLQFIRFLALGGLHCVSWEDRINICGLWSDERSQWLVRV